MIKKNIQWSLKQIIIMIRKNKILFNNVFQRSYVWERSRQSRLIHSFLEDYPVPALYAVCKGEGKDKVYDMLDGKQRLEAVRAYMNDEFALIKNHPVMGARILKNIKEMPQLSSGARWHHERYDGKGYPDGLAGKDIPEEARIIAIADSSDAMTSRRSYRDPLPQDVVRNEIVKGKGTQFDPDLADIMLKMIDEDTGFDMREQ